MLNLNQLIDTARRNPKVDELYHRVDIVTPINFECRSDGYWSHVIDDGKSIIGVSPTEYPQECLFHELLHADLKNNGHISYLGFIGNESQMNELETILPPINEELQHHRMFGSFIDAGFKSEHFYSHLDLQTYSDLHLMLTKMPGNLSAAHMLPQFLSIIAPGGAMSESNRQELVDIIKSKSPTAFSQLESIAAILEGWAASSEVDPGLTVLKILRILNRYDGTWIGHPPGEFPHDGHFVGTPFAI